MRQSHTHQAAAIPHTSADALHAAHTLSMSPSMAEHSDDLPDPTRPTTAAVRDTPIHNMPAGTCGQAIARIPVSDPVRNVRLMSRSAGSRSLPQVNVPASMAASPHCGAPTREYLARAAHANDSRYP
jgi:hypothetical protein